MATYSVTDNVPFNRRGLFGVMDDAVKAMDAEPVLQCKWPGVMASPAPVTLGHDVTLKGNGCVISKYGLVVRANCVIENFRFMNIASGDAIQVIGERARHVVIKNCFFDNRESLKQDADEAISVVWGAGSEGVYIVDCVIQNFGKGMLIGCGDRSHRKAESKTKVYIKKSVFHGNSRRNPYARYCEVVLDRCIIEDWGKTWDIKSYGVRAAEGAVIRLSNCSLRQHPNAWFKPHVALDLMRGGGPHKGAIEESGGKIICTNTTIQPDWVK